MSFTICTIGCGSHATKNHGPAYAKYAATHPDTILAACCDLSEDKAMQFRHRFGFARHYTDLETMLRQEKPDAVLMDIVMPGLNGFQATRQLTKDADTNHIPVIVVTTKDQEPDQVWAKRQGARDYLTKPVDEDTLIRILNSVLAG